MTDTAWTAELAISCAACDASAGEACRNDQGEPVPYMHIDRVTDAAASRQAPAPDTVQPDPQAVAWMRDYLRRYPDADRYEVRRAYFQTHPTSELSLDVRAVSWEAACKPQTVADIPAGHGAASLFIRVEQHGYRSLRSLQFKAADGTTRGVPYGAALDPCIPERTALWEHLAATLPTIEDATHTQPG